MEKHLELQGPNPLCWLKMWIKQNCSQFLLSRAMGTCGNTDSGKSMQRKALGIAVWRYSCTELGWINVARLKLSYAKPQDCFYNTLCSICVRFLTDTLPVTCFFKIPFSFFFLSCRQAQNCLPMWKSVRSPCIEMFVIGIYMSALCWRIIRWAGKCSVALIHAVVDHAWGLNWQAKG